MKESVAEWLRAEYAINAEEVQDRRTPDLLRRIERLPDWQRNILYLYAEKASIAEVGKALGVSKSTAQGWIKRIKEEIWR